MRVLVTGASGFAGRHLLHALLERGAEITAGTMDGAPQPSPWLTAEEISRVRWVHLDVSSRESVAAVVQESAPQHTYHLAAQSSVGDSFRKPMVTWDVNATGTLRLLDALQQREEPGARLLLVSSAEVYGAVPEEAQPIPETAPLSPVTPYGASKAAAEMIAKQAAATSGVQVVIARSFNHAGPKQDERFVLPSIAGQLNQLRRESDPELHVGNLAARRDFLDVRDVVRAYIWMMERGENGGVYNVCSGVAPSLQEVVETLVELSGSGARIVVDPERFRPTDIPLLVGDASRLRALGWEPQIPLEETLRSILDSAGSA